MPSYKLRGRQQWNPAQQRLEGLFENLGMKDDVTMQNKIANVAEAIANAKRMFFAYFRKYIARCKA